MLGKNIIRSGKWGSNHILSKHKGYGGKKPIKAALSSERSRGSSRGTGDGMVKAGRQHGEAVGSGER